jgi:hypothetical protein
MDREFNVELFVENIKKNINIKTVKVYPTEVIELLLGNGVKLYVSYRNASYGKYIIFLKDSSDQLINNYFKYGNIFEIVKNLTVLYTKINDISIQNK